MLVYRSLAQLSRIRRPLVLVAGAFYGVHRGHATVIRQALRSAAKLRAEVWVLTFEPHPLRVLNPKLAPARLTSAEHRLKLLGALGVDGSLVLPFDRKLADLEPEEFIERLCRAAPRLKRMVVGQNWTFGRGARGDVALLRKLARRHRIAVSIARPLKFKGQPISSTRIRELAAKGRFDDAAQMLGRPFSIRGTVVHGKKLGRKLGFRTANVDPHNEVRPPPGIYAAYAVIRGRSHPAAVYLDGRSDIVEAHLIGRDLDLYGQNIELRFVQKVGALRRCADDEALKKKIGRDVEAARRVLTSA